MEEDAVNDAAKDIIPTFSAINVKNMVIMRMIVTPKNVAIVAELAFCKRLSSREKCGRNNQPSFG